MPNGHRKGSAFERRFWSKTAISGADDCWLWNGTKLSNGYGQFWDGKKIRLAHRCSFVYTHGKIPDGGLVLHKCDNPRCVNPRHLFVGSHHDNAKDMISKGRSLFGRRANGVKLKEDEVREILSLKGQGLYLKQVADRFGVHLSLIHLIWRRRIWKHL